MTDQDVPSEGTSGPEYAARLARLEGARWKQVLDVQRPYRWNLSRLARGRVLEVGCGIGRNLVGLSNAAGVDHNGESIALARGRGLTAWTTDEWPTSPDAVPGSYDTLLLAHVLEHMDEEEANAVMRGYLDYLRPTARLILICPQERGYRTDATHVRFLDGAALDRTARSLGFTPVRNRSFPFPRPAGRFFPYNEFVLVADR